MPVHVYTDPALGYTEHISAILMTVIIVKKLATTHPHVMTTGPPVSNPKLITKHSDVITAIEEKQKLKDIKALKPFIR